MLLIKNIEVFSPKNIGIKDVLITNGIITLIEDRIESFSKKIDEIDGTGKILIPGLIDNHVHITGGGGEGSFKTRVPEITLSKLIEGGITTVVGLLGTDGITRNVENLVAKAKSLKEEGISVYAHTGSYGYPSITLTDSVKKDIVFIDEIIGVKIALSDHRSPSISKDELARLASDARVAGMISGKAGIVVAHMGDGRKGLSLINEVLEETEIPIRTIRPTHVNRREELLMESFDYAKRRNNRFNLWNV
jgi:beta-aspartyl-dipeptidase (metallo-type)